MVQFAVLIAGLLLMVESQASDVADSSALQGFLSNYVPAATQRMPTSLNAYVPAGLSEAEWKARQKDEAAKKAANKLKYPKGPPFLGVKEYLTGLANKQTFKNGKVKDTGHVYVKTKYDWSGAKKDGSVRYNSVAGESATKKNFKNPFSKFLSPAVSNVMHGNGPDALSSHHNEDFEEEKTVQKIVANDSNMPMSLAAIGIGLVSLATMLGVRMRRGLQSASVLGSDMSVAMARASGENFLELEAQESASQNSRNSLPLTPCYATVSGSNTIWDPLGLGEVKNFRKSELQHGLVAMSSVFFVSPQNSRPISASEWSAVSEDASALLEQAAALRAEADALADEQIKMAATPSAAATATATPAPTPARELTPEEKTLRDIENRKKISEALISATKARNKEQIQIALATAEKAGGFSGSNPEIIAAVKVFNELNELDDNVRKKLVADMRKGDPSSAEYTGGLNAYLGIFGLVGVLVIAGGKGIFY